jgi:Family of unknown function (DUF6335)
MINDNLADLADDEFTEGMEIEQDRLSEIDDAPRAPDELEQRVRENHSASPADSGGDIDAQWEEVNTSGSESVFGDNPTPDQSDVEANAHAMGINFEDNEPLDFIKKLEKRDDDRYELDESSKSDGDTI